MDRKIKFSIAPKSEYRDIVKLGQIQRIQLPLEASLLSPP